MGLGERIGAIIINWIVILPLFILFFASAIISSMAQAHVAKLVDQSDPIKRAHEYLQKTTITLWVLFAISIVVLGPFLGVIAAWPYIFTFIMTIFMLIALAIAGVFFYAAFAVRNSTDYKKGDSTAHSTFNNLIGVGAAMIVAILLLLVYNVWAIRKYRAMGGMSADIGSVSELALAIGAPELELPAMIGKDYAKRNTTSDQYTAAINNPGIAYINNMNLALAQKQQALNAQQALLTANKQQFDAQLAASGQLPLPAGNLQLQAVDPSIFN